MSYDDCRENKKQDCENCSMLSSVHSYCTHTHEHFEQFFQITVGLGFGSFLVHFASFFLTIYGHIKTVKHRTIIQQYGDWYTGR